MGQGTATLELMDDTVGAGKVDTRCACRYGWAVGLSQGLLGCQSGVVPVYSVEPMVATRWQSLEAGRRIAVRLGPRSGSAKPVNVGS